MTNKFWLMHKFASQYQSPTFTHYKENYLGVFAGAVIFLGQDVNVSRPDGDYSSFVDEFVLSHKTRLMLGIEQYDKYDNLITAKYEYKLWNSRLVSGNALELLTTYQNYVQVEGAINPLIPKSLHSYVTFWAMPIYEVVQVLKYEDLTIICK